MPLGVGRRLDPHAPRVDGNHHGLVRGRGRGRGGGGGRGMGMGRARVGVRVGLGLGFSRTAITCLP